MIKEELIFLDTEFESQEEIFHFLAKQIVKQGIARDINAVFEALNKRETEGTTGMMDGFAIPHGKSEAIVYPAIVIVKQAKEIDWDSLDGKPTRNIIAMFIPLGESGTSYLSTLSQVARMLMKEDFKTEFEQAKTEKELFELISTRLNGGM